MNYLYNTFGNGDSVVFHSCYIDSECAEERSLPGDYAPPWLMVHLRWGSLYIGRRYGVKWYKR